MTLFRRIGRQVELFRQIAKQTAKDASISRCQACGAWIPGGGEGCLYCGHLPPHAVLGVAPDAPEAIVKAAARAKLKIAHPDRGGSQSEFQRVKQARDQILKQ